MEDPFIDPSPSLARHLRQLPTDHRVLYELLSEGAALVREAPGTRKKKRIGVMWNRMEDNGR